MIELLDELIESQRAVILAAEEFVGESVLPTASSRLFSAVRRMRELRSLIDENFPEWGHL